MIPLLYQLSYTAPKKFRGLRYCIGGFLSRKSEGSEMPPHSKRYTVKNLTAPDSNGRIRLDLAFEA